MKFVQPVRFKTSLQKTEAIQRVEEHVNQNLSDYKPGELIEIGYINGYGTESTVAAIIVIKDGVATIVASVTENETLRIVETDTEPLDKGVLWLTEDDGEHSEDDQTAGLKDKVDSLIKKVNQLNELVEKDDYALSNTIAGGDIILNSEKYREENENDQEKPEDAIDYTEYATEDFNIDSFELYVAGSPLSAFTGGDNPSLYDNEKYYLKLRLYNSGMELIPDDEGITLQMDHEPMVEWNEERRWIMATMTGSTSLYAKITDESGNSITNQYFVDFKHNEKPNYGPYEEPNVHHLLIKTAESFSVLQQNANYLCLNEFCWCIKEAKMYFKAMDKFGIVRLYELSGGGGSEPVGPDDDSGSTVDTRVIYDVDTEGLFSATSSDGSVNVDNEGVLTLVGTVDEETGTIILVNR